MALVTIPSLEGEPIEDVANTIFRAWGVGQKGKNEGILMLLAIGDRRSRLEVGYGSGADSARRPGRQHPARDAAGAAPGGLRRCHDGGGRDHRQHHRASQERDTDRASLPRRYRPGASDSIPWPMICRRSLSCCCWLMRARTGRAATGAAAGILPA